MIRHIVFFTAKRTEDLDRIREYLLTLREIPFPHVFEVAMNSKSDPLSDEVDIVVYAEFSNQAELEAYRNHPHYCKVTSLVKPLRDQRVSADITV